MSEKHNKLSGVASDDLIEALSYLAPIIRQERYISSSSKAKALLVDICLQYNGFNNGDFCLTLSVMRARGWVSNDTLTRATRELVEAGLLELTRQGGRNKCNRYGLSFIPNKFCASAKKQSPQVIKVNTLPAVILLT